MRVLRNVGFVHPERRSLEILRPIATLIVVLLSFPVVVSQNDVPMAQVGNKDSTENAAGNFHHENTKSTFESMQVRVNAHALIRVSVNILMKSELEWTQRGTEISFLDNEGTTATGGVLQSRTWKLQIEEVRTSTSHALPAMIGMERELSLVWQTERPSMRQSNGKYRFEEWKEGIDDDCNQAGMYCSWGHSATSFLIELDGTEEALVNAVHHKEQQKLGERQNDSIQNPRIEAESIAPLISRRTQRTVIVTLFEKRTIPSHPPTQTVLTRRLATLPTVRYRNEITELGNKLGSSTELQESIKSGKEQLDPVIEVHLLATTSFRHEIQSSFVNDEMGISPTATIPSQVPNEPSFLKDDKRVWSTSRVIIVSVVAVFFLIGMRCRVLKRRMQEQELLLQDPPQLIRRSPCPEDPIFPALEGEWLPQYLEEEGSPRATSLHYESSRLDYQDVESDDEKDSHEASSGNYPGDDDSSDEFSNADSDDSDSHSNEELISEAETSQHSSVDDEPASDDESKWEDRRRTSFLETTDDSKFHGEQPTGVHLLVHHSMLSSSIDGDDYGIDRDGAACFAEMEELQEPTTKVSTSDTSLQPSAAHTDLEALPSSEPTMPSKDTNLLDQIEHTVDDKGQSHAPSGTTEPTLKDTDKQPHTPSDDAEESTPNDMIEATCTERDDKPLTNENSSPIDSVKSAHSMNEIDVTSTDDPAEAKSDLPSSLDVQQPTHQPSSDVLQMEAVSPQPKSELSSLSSGSQSLQADSSQNTPVKNTVAMAEVDLEQQEHPTSFNSDLEQQESPTSPNSVNTQNEEEGNAKTSNPDSPNTEAQSFGLSSHVENPISSIQGTPASKPQSFNEKEPESIETGSNDGNSCTEECHAKKEVEVHESTSTTNLFPTINGFANNPGITTGESGVQGRAESVNRPPTPCPEHEEKDTSSMKPPLCQEDVLTQYGWDRSQQSQHNHGSQVFRFGEVLTQYSEDISQPTLGNEYDRIHGDGIGTQDAKDPGLQGFDDNDSEISQSHDDESRHDNQLDGSYGVHGATGEPFTPDYSKMKQRQNAWDVVIEEKKVSNDVEEEPNQSSVSPPKDKTSVPEPASEVVEKGSTAFPPLTDGCEQPEVGVHSQALPGTDASSRSTTENNATVNLGADVEASTDICHTQRMDRRHENAVSSEISDNRKEKPELVTENRDLEVAKHGDAASLAGSSYVSTLPPDSHSHTDDDLYDSLSFTTSNAAHTQHWSPKVYIRSKKTRQPEPRSKPKSPQPTDISDKHSEFGVTTRRRRKRMDRSVSPKVFDLFELASWESPAVNVKVLSKDTSAVKEGRKSNELVGMTVPCPQETKMEVKQSRGKRPREADSGTSSLGSIDSDSVRVVDPGLFRRSYQTQSGIVPDWVPSNRLQEASVQFASDQQWRLGSVDQGQGKKGADISTYVTRSKSGALIARSANTPQRKAKLRKVV